MSLGLPTSQSELKKPLGHWSYLELTCILSDPITGGQITVHRCECTGVNATKKQYLEKDPRGFLQIWHICLLRLKDI